MITQRDKEEDNIENFITLEDINLYIDSFGEDKPSMVQYIKIVSSYKNWSIPRTVLEMKKNPAFTQQKFEAWKAR